MVAIKRMQIYGIAKQSLLEAFLSLYEIEQIVQLPWNQRLEMAWKSMQTVWKALDSWLDCLHLILGFTIYWLCDSDITPKSALAGENKTPHSV